MFRYLNEREKSNMMDMFKNNTTSNSAMFCKEMQMPPFHVPGAEAGTIDRLCKILINHLAFLRKQGRRICDILS